ncbi:MAG: hypothetical protein ACQESO_07710, partial [Bacillota bacterium]
MPVIALMVASILVITPVIILFGNGNLQPANVLYGTDGASGSANELSTQSTWDGSIHWAGYPQGSDSEGCDLVNTHPKRTESGWIHWILSGNQANIDLAVLQLGGTGSGTYDPEGYGSGSMQFYTPYFNLEGLTAFVSYMGIPAANSSLIISDYCPGRDTPDLGCLEVEKIWNSSENPTDPISVNITGLDVTYSGSVILNETNNWKARLCSLTPGTYTFEEVTVSGWSPTYLPANRQLVVVAGSEPVSGAIGTITNTPDTPDLGCLEIVKLFEDYPEGTDLPESITVKISGDV